MAVEIVGREEELGSLSGFLDARPEQPGARALALEGEAGIGKSTLWRIAAGDAAARGLRVLTTQPAEAERGLAHAGLGDLFEDVLVDVGRELTAPRRRALEAALLVGDGAGDPVDARALGVAVRSVLELLAADGVVLAIDDLQWLDAPSAAALAFALRRLGTADVRLLWTRRLGAPHQGIGLENALDERVERIRVGPLSVGAMHGVLRSALGRAIPRPTLLRLHEVSGGNPFYALELARALGDADAAHDPTQPLPVPERLEELVSARLAGFSGETREALVLASADARLAPSHLLAAGVDPDALAPALDAGVVDLERESVRFTHPLLASVLYQGLTVERRRQAHRTLAGVVADPLARARHLALSTDAQDAELSGILEEAATLADGLGASSVAAELAEHAIRLTPEGERLALDRRSAVAARAHRATGEVERARTVAEAFLARAEPGPERAEALALCAEVTGNGIAHAVALQREALSEPGVSATQRVSLHQRLSLNLRFHEGLDAAEEQALAAVELAEELDDDGLRAVALGGLALLRFNAAKGGALELAERAFALAAAADDRQRVAAEFTYGHVLVWSHELERARPLFERIYEEWSDRDETHAAMALWYLSMTELRAGRLELADRYAADSRELVGAYAQAGTESPTSFFPSALVAAHRGDLARARELAHECLQRSELHDTRLAGPLGILGLVELWSGDAAAADRCFAGGERIPHPPDHSDPNMAWWRLEHVEALLGLGRVDDAVARLDPLEAAARRLGREWAIAHATRCRGRVAAARGEVPEAVALLEDAVAAHAGIGDEFGRGRALLALGAVRRRARQKRPARDAIEAAVAAFEGIGAAGWAARAREELGRIGGRTRIEGLTPAERRVADLVAEGRTNAEVAAALFLAERTVASHLTHVYGKLGVRSRTELSRKLGSKAPTF
jgi:DNA-binding CsgD family transcriptional regulator